MKDLFYGVLPDVVKNIAIDTIDEMHFSLYMPLVMPENPLLDSDLSSMEARFDGLLKPLAPLALGVILNESIQHNQTFPYWYITSKKMYVTPDNMANRPGWHSDGFGTSDVNYVWTDQKPTEFVYQAFDDLSADHTKSLKQFDDQIDERNIICYRENDLLRLTEQHIHRVPVSSYEGMRHFIKVTGSNHRFNLKGNSLNHRLNYDWKTYSREEMRNMESVKDNSDFIEEAPNLTVIK